MRKSIYSIKVGALIEPCGKNRNIFLSVLFLFIITTKLSATTSYKINDRARIYSQEISSDSLVLKIDNDFTIPVSLLLDLHLENLNSNHLPEMASVVPAKAIGFVLAKFKKTDSDIPYKLSYNWKIVLGDVSKTPDPSYLYGLPYQQSSNFKISQGPEGEFSHKEMFAYDFAMPVGTPVLATRDGIVAIIKSDSSIGGPNKEFIEDANFISVYHSDGSIANYLHLNTNGVLVKEGQEIKKGELIGFSGNTGFSSGPHLHFEVLQPGFNAEKKKWLSFNWEQNDNTLVSVLGK
ncbi:MAG: M23 family metallopeptidase [Sphingobacteriaceae bacterium]